MTEDDIEQRLTSLMPRGPQPELRSRVLAAVAHELEKPRATPWLRRATLCAAALLLLGIGLNILVTAASDRRRAQLFGPTPVGWPAGDMTSVLAGAAEDQTATGRRERSVAPSRGKNGAVALAAYCRWLERIADPSFFDLRTPHVELKVPGNETPQKDPQMDRSDHSGLGRDRAGGQCLVRRDHRFTA